MKEQKLIGFILCVIAAVMLAMKCGSAGLIFAAWGIYCVCTKKVWVR